MKYTTEIIIEKPRDVVIEKLDNPENMKHWQRGLLGYQLVEGEPGSTGAKMSLSYEMGKRKMEMMETIVKQNFPDEFHAHYDTKGVHNIQENYFTVTKDGHTKWTSISTFVFSSLPMKMIGILMPKAFKKQSKKYLEDFKAFVEHDQSVLHS